MVNADENAQLFYGLGAMQELPAQMLPKEVNKGDLMALQVDLGMAYADWIQAGKVPPNVELRVKNLEKEVHLPSLSLKNSPKQLAERIAVLGEEINKDPDSPQLNKFLSLHKDFKEVQKEIKDRQKIAEVKYEKVAAEVRKTLNKVFPNSQFPENYKVDPTLNAYENRKDEYAFKLAKAYWDARIFQITLIKREVTIENADEKLKLSDILPILEVLNLSEKISKAYDDKSVSGIRHLRQTSLNQISLNRINPGQMSLLQISLNQTSQASSQKKIFVDESYLGFQRQANSKNTSEEKDLIRAVFRAVYSSFAKQEVSSILQGLGKTIHFGKLDPMRNRARVLSLDSIATEAGTKRSNSSSLESNPLPADEAKETPASFKLPKLGRN